MFYYNTFRTQAPMKTFLNWFDKELKNCGKSDLLCDPRTIFSHSQFKNNTNIPNCPQCIGYGSALGSIQFHFNQFSKWIQENKNIHNAFILFPISIKLTWLKLNWPQLWHTPFLQKYCLSRITKTHVSIIFPGCIIEMRNFFQEKPKNTDSN